MSKKSIGFYAAISIVISNMIGVGVFTSLGYQVLDLKQGSSIMILWLLGGLTALLGALCYGEIGVVFPRSGGEYNYLSKIYHPIIGFLSGWVSATVGFAAPVAASAMALGKYSSEVFTFLSPQWIAASVVILMAVIHSLQVKIGQKVQTFFTALNVLIIIIIIISGFVSGRTGTISFELSSNVWEEIMSPAFAVSFFYVNLAYSGWNAAAYIAGEMDSPQRNLPRSLLRGTLFVTVLYLLINFIFLYTTPISALEGKSEAGLIASIYIFGNTGGKIMGMIIAMLLLASVSSMTLAGPRVTSTMGEDIQLFKLFSKNNNFGVPMFAILLQSIISLFFIFTASFDVVITYISFTLNIFLFLTVLGLLVLRITKPNIERPYKTWGYPVTPILFLMVSMWLTYRGFTEKPKESLAGMATVFVGLIFYYINMQLNSNKNEN